MASTRVIAARAYKKIVVAAYMKHRGDWHAFSQNTAEFDAFIRSLRDLVDLAVQRGGARGSLEAPEDAWRSLSRQFFAATSITRGQFRSAFAQLAKPLTSQCEDLLRFSIPEGAAAAATRDEHLRAMLALAYGEGGIGAAVDYAMLSRVIYVEYPRNPDAICE